MNKKHHSHAHPEADGLKSATDIALERASDVASDDSSSLSQELDDLRIKVKDHWDQLLRARADLDNYRKRAAREKQDLVKTANEKLLIELLSPLDHFEMGLQASPNTEPVDPFRQGMEMVLAQFHQFLKLQGVTEIQTTGQMFDPALHEAVAHQESDLPEGQIVQQLRKGYRLNDKLLRAATVVVSKGPAAMEKA